MNDEDYLDNFDEEFEKKQVKRVEEESDEKIPTGCVISIIVFFFIVLVFGTCSGLLR